MGAESALTACIFFYQPDDTHHQAFPYLPELETLDQKERLLAPSEHRESVRRAGRGFFTSTPFLRGHSLPAKIILNYDRLWKGMECLCQSPPSWGDKPSLLLDAGWKGGMNINREEAAHTERQ